MYIFFGKRNFVPLSSEIRPCKFGQILTAKGFQRTPQTLPGFSVISSENFKCM